MKQDLYQTMQREASELFAKASIILTEEERQNIEVADFGLGRVRDTGLQLVTYINTERVCAKEMALLPGQTCPEHRHPTVDGQPGKEETFRCRRGLVRLYVEGEPAAHPVDTPSGVYTVFHEVILLPGEQYTIWPGTLHWFRAGEEGAVISEFSTRSRDESDQFSDPAIVRIPVLEDAPCS